MEKNSYHIIGVMSGTSLDGVDLAEIFLNRASGAWNFELGVTTTTAYTDTWRNELKLAVSYSEEKLNHLNLRYTELLASMITEFIDNHEIRQLDAVCSHGHTILHQPEKGVTLQIGNLPKLAKLIQQIVVCDFRVQDVALGGQGAPLVPIGDAMLFDAYNYCLNLGGFANCSFEHDGQRLAYDICPVNIVLNPLAAQLGFAYDDKGLLAASGTFDQRLFDKLNRLKFYEDKAPKSLGLEWVQQNFLPILNASEGDVKSKLRTVTEHVAHQIAKQFTKNSTVLITGGGAYNDYLLERIRYHTEIEIVLPSEGLIEYKEALVFGLLGVLKLRNEANCLASVTGAQKNHSSGFVYQP